MAKEWYQLNNHSLRCAPQRVLYILQYAALPSLVHFCVHALANSKIFWFKIVLWSQSGPAATFSNLLIILVLGGLGRRTPLCV